jgi:hypothetical protein
MLKTVQVPLRLHLHELRTNQMHNGTAAHLIGLHFCSDAAVLHVCGQLSFKVFCNEITLGEGC